MSNTVRINSFSSNKSWQINDALPLNNQLSYSMRRYFVDEFQTRLAAEFPEGSIVLDLGGVKSMGRGTFNLETYPVNRVVINIDQTRMVDLVADGARVPFRAKSFDIVLCAEVLEHVIFPQAVIEEARRLLKPDGKLVITVPFLFREHADPQDYGRYTEYYWRKTLESYGFEEITIEKQGLFFSVATDMLRDWARFQALSKTSSSRVITWILSHLVRWARQKSLLFETKSKTAEHPFWGSYTTGFGIRAKLAR